MLTGGPGSEKTSIIDGLIGRAVYCVPEATRDIIAEQLRISGSAVPWSDARTFRELMLARDIDTYYANLERMHVANRTQAIVNAQEC